MATIAERSRVLSYRAARAFLEEEYGHTVSRTTLERAYKAGEIEGQKFGDADNGRVLLNEASLASWFESRAGIEREEVQ